MQIKHVNFLKNKKLHKLNKINLKKHKLNRRRKGIPILRQED